MNWFCESRQNDHVCKILSSNVLDPLVNDDFYDKIVTHNYALCDTLYEIVTKRPRFHTISKKPIHDFSYEELNIVNMEYMEKIYNSKNFPLTYRHNAIPNFTNASANRVFYSMCKDYYTKPDNPLAGYYIGAFMLFVIVLHFMGIVN
jgi:hypothetical protein